MPRVLISKTSITGEVKAFAGTLAPEGYLFCQGQAVSRTTYVELFAAIGIAHGQGDGSSTFNLPDYRGQFLRGRVNISTVTGSGTAGSNQTTFTAHGINRTGFRVRLSSGTLSGLAASTDYFAIVVDANTLAFATTQANALANTRTAISGANSAVITQYEDPDASSRAASNVGGSSGDAVGSVQSDSYASHTHIQNAHNHAQRFSGATAPSVITAGAQTNTTQSGTNTESATAINQNSGGNETRVKNVTVNYIIKY